MLIGVVGSIGSGKDTMADYLVKKGFEHVSQSSLLREIMTGEGQELSVPNMTKYGNNLRITKGHGYLATMALGKIKSDKAVITSIRQVGEIEVLQKRNDFVLVKTDAPIELRIDRLQKRNRDGDVKTLEELQSIEKLQASGEGASMNMDACFKLADVEIINDGTIEEFQQKIDQFLAEQKK